MIYHYGYTIRDKSYLLEINHIVYPIRSSLCFQIVMVVMHAYSLRNYLGDTITEVPFSISYKLK